MGFGEGKQLLTKPEARIPTGGAKEWQKEHVVLEAHSFLTYGTLGHLPVPYQLALARHYHADVVLTAECRKFVADYIATKMLQTLAGLFLHLPGSDEYDPTLAPTLVEFVMESNYGPKDLCSKLREQSRSAGFEKDVVSGVTIPDCVMMAAVEDLNSRQDCVVTIPPAEFDAMVPVRLRQGCKVISKSGDSDLFMYIAGWFEGSLFFTGSKGTMLQITWQDKARTMAERFGVDVTTLTVTESVFMQYEALYLQVALAGKHDYNHRERPSGAIYNSTKVGWVTLLTLFAEVGETFRPKRGGNMSTQWRATQDGIKEAAAFARKAIEDNGTCDLSTDQLSSAFDAFWKQPMSFRCGAQKAKTVTACAAAQSYFALSKAKAAVRIDDPATEMSAYNYRGGCGQSCKTTAKDVFDLRLVCASPGIAWKNVACDPSKDFLTAASEAMGRTPSLPLRDVVYDAQFRGTMLDQYVDETDLSGLSTVLQCLPRAAQIPKQSWRVAQVPTQLLPADFPEKVNGVEVFGVVVECKVLQSYGAKTKEKAGTKVITSSNEYYNTRVFYMVSRATGKVIAPPYGYGPGKLGAIATACPCRSVFPFCRHVRIQQIGLSTLSENAQESSTSGPKYWDNYGDVDPDVLQGRAIRIAECYVGTLNLRDLPDATEKNIADLGRYALFNSRYLMYRPLVEKKQAALERLLVVGFSCPLQLTSPTVSFLMIRKS